MVAFTIFVCVGRCNLRMKGKSLGVIFKQTKKKYLDLYQTRTKTLRNTLQLNGLFCPDIMFCTKDFFLKRKCQMVNNVIHVAFQQYF